jgi:hypothetical protein
VREEKRKPPEEERDERSGKAPRKFVQLSRDRAREKEREREAKNTHEEKERKGTVSDRNIRSEGARLKRREDRKRACQRDAKGFYSLVDIVAASGRQEDA